MKLIWLFKKEKKENEEKDIREWWEIPPEESSMKNSTENTPKTSFFSKFGSIDLKSRLPRRSIGRPRITGSHLKIAVALSLILVYGFVLLFSVTSFPSMIFLIFPTLWVLIDYIQLRRSRN